MRIEKKLPPTVEKGVSVALDIEMFNQEDNRLHRPTGTFACLSICIAGQSVVYQIYKTEEIQEALRRLKDAKYWIFQNALYDLRQLRRWANIPEVMVWDTMLVERHLFGGYYDRFSLADLSRRWLGKRMDKEVRQEFTDSTEMTQEMIKYAAKDAVITGDIFQHQQNFIKEDDVDMRSYWIDSNAIWAILDMKPIKVDVKRWMETAEKHQKEADYLEQEVLGFNSKSPAKVKKAINAMLPAGERIRSTSKAKVLEPFLASNREKYPEVCELVENIILARRYRDACSKYGERWIMNYVEEGGYVHPNWRITGAETGRMSCADPNLQQIPSRDLPVFREFFIPSDENHRIMVADVSQQEPRILAYFSKDKVLLDAIYSKEDLHLTVTRAIFHDETLTKKSPERRIGKAINLGTSYGLTEYGLARNLGISEDEAREFLRRYFTRFRGVSAWQSQQRRNGHSLGYIRTAMGRRVWINPYSSGWQNVVINAPIQGSAAEHTKLALTILHRKCKEMKIEFPVTMLIHDEYVLDFPADKEDIYRKLAVDAFVEAGKELIGDIPISVDVGVGESWGAK